MSMKNWQYIFQLIGENQQRRCHFIAAFEKALQQQDRRMARLFKRQKLTLYTLFDRAGRRQVSGLYYDYQQAADYCRRHHISARQLDRLEQILFQLIDESLASHFTPVLKTALSRQMAIFRFNLQQQQPKRFHVNWWRALGLSDNK